MLPRQFCLGEALRRDPMTIYRNLQEEWQRNLSLFPSHVSNVARGSTIIKGILSSLSKISQHTDELRGLYGTGHGHDGGHRGLQPRHARLAASAAIT